MSEDPATIDIVEALDFGFEEAAWAFETTSADAIDAVWSAALRHKPRLFDGRVLMLRSGGIVREGGRGVLRGVFTPVAFKAFLAWRELGHPDRERRNGFGMAALRGADGAFVLGEMAPHTATAGRVYFPAGTPDLNDVRGATVDIAASIRRELGEETGLDPASLAFADHFVVVQDTHRVAVMQEVRAAETATQLVARIMANLAAQPDPEFARLHVARSPADITSAMPPFVGAYLRHAFAAQPG